MRTIVRIGLKALGLFLALNLLFAALDPMPAARRASVYNLVVPGRLRLPFGNDLARSCNLPVSSLDAMFASHAVAAPKARDEYRVVLIGDSSVWGVLLEPDDTLAGQLDALGLERDGRRVRVHNLGYPDFSLAKDALVLDRALAHRPDMVVWLVTANSFPSATQSSHAVVANHAADHARLAMNRDLPANRPALQETVLDRTIIGRRRELAELARLQTCGLFWAATGKDQVVDRGYEPWTRDLDADDTFGSLRPPTLERADLALAWLDVGAEWARAAGAQFILVNEPIARSDGRNSELRYNAFYPRWAYDQYRDLLGQLATERGWMYIDAWDLVPNTEFTNSPVHLTKLGTAVLARRLAAALRAMP